jgi:hypothetical protein
LPNSNLITLLNTESWRNVRSKVLVSLLVTGVLWDEMKIFSADDQSSVHLGRNDGTGQNTATDGDETGEWALLVCNDWKSVYCTFKMCAKGSSLPISQQRPNLDSQNRANSYKPPECTYQYSGPQSQSLVFGIPIQRPCTIFVHPFQPWTSPLTWSSRRCEVASGMRAPIAR